MVVYKLKPDSKLHQSSEVQAEALSALRAAAPASGIVVLPCGTGKTSVFLQAAHDAGLRVLFLCYEKQGVVQVAETIRENSTIDPAHLCVYTSDIKTEPNLLFCYMVTTYGMFATNGSARSERTQKVRSFVRNLKWDLVVLDEVHHAAAATYKPFVQHLVGNAKRVLGFTGTLCRNELAAAATSRERASALGDGPPSAEARDAVMEELFAFVGKLLHSRNCRELEALGLIARVRRMEVPTRLTPAFATAHRMVSGSTRKYVESLHPEKINALWAIVQLHAALGEIGMVFVNHLLHAKVVQALLGDKWAILSGGNAHGTDGTHTAEANAEIVRRFNAGELLGLVSTPVGESALNVVNPDFRYAVVVDAHGGPASASQKLGRLSRTPRLAALPDESTEALRARRVREQKVGFYYEIVTLDTEEMTAAENRHAQFDREGYACRSIAYDRLAAKALALETGAEGGGGPPPSLPCAAAAAQTKLLIEALSYRSLGVAEAEGSYAAKEVVGAHRGSIHKLEHKARTSKTALFRERRTKQAQTLKRQTPSVKEDAKTLKRSIVKSCPLSPAVVAVLRAVKADPVVLAELGVALPPPKDQQTEARQEPETDCE